MKYSPINELAPVITLPCFIFTGDGDGVNLSGAVTKGDRSDSQVELETQRKWMWLGHSRLYWKESQVS